MPKVRLDACGLKPDSKSSREETKFCVCGPAGLMVPLSTWAKYPISSPPLNGRKRTGGESRASVTKPTRAAELQCDCRPGRTRTSDRRLADNRAISHHQPSLAKQAKAATPKPTWAKAGDTTRELRLGKPSCEWTKQARTRIQGTDHGQSKV